MRSVTIGALLLALLAPATAAAAPAPAGTPVVVPSQLPRGGHPTMPWVDAADQVIHDGDRTIALAPRLPQQRLVEVWRAGGSYLALGSRNTVYRVAADGTYSPLVTYTDSAPAVEDSGLRFAVAASDQTTGEPSLEVVRVADGVVETRLRTDVRDVFDFTDGVVTFEAPRRQGKSFSRLSTWDTRGQSIDLGSRRLADPAYVDVGAGLMSRQVYGDFEGAVVLPLRRGAFTPWRAELSSVESVSPNGRRVVTYRLSGEDSSVAPGTLTVRDARTGATQREVRVVLGGVSGWEDNRSLLFNAYAEKKDGYALVRLDVRTGTLERLSGYSLNDVDRLFAG